jgi:very-short-patch-repair endonuclease
MGYQKKMQDPEFNAWFRNQVSKGQIKSYKNSSTHLKRVTISNQEKGKRENWGWKNEEKRTKDMIKARIAMGKNHNGKTYLEKKVEWWLKKENIQYESQKYFNNGYRKFWVDFYLPEYNIIIEADGKYWHNAIDDQLRDIELKKVFAGKIIHFKEDDIRNNFEACISKLDLIMTTQNCFVDVEVRKVLKWNLEKEIYVYNLEVEDDNTYTANKIIVHNCSKCEELAKGSPYTLEQVQYMIPVHPACRCCIIPMIVH